MPAKRRQGPNRLREYRAKRDFQVTTEPTGNESIRSRHVKAKTKERFFCVQKHLASHLHYDFRLEHNGVLISWAIPKGPSLNPADKRLAVRVEDHPIEYGDFEGVIPEGYGAGIVVLWDGGTWQPLAEDVDEALANGQLKFNLNGTKLKGSWVLVRAGRSGPGETGGRAWLLIKHRDGWSGDVDVINAFPKSVKSGGDFAEILAADSPAIWKSHRPARGGVAGAMLAEIIEQAAALKAQRQKSPHVTADASRRPRARRRSARKPRGA